MKVKSCMANVNFKLTSSLEKCFWDTEIKNIPEHRSASALRGERYSFQMAWRGTDATLDQKKTMYLNIDSSLKDYITVKSVESVPVRFPVYKTWTDPDYLRTEPGLYPDLMIPVPESGRVYTIYADTRCIWVDVEIPNDCPVGEMPIKLSFSDVDGELIFEDTFVLNVIGAEMPEQTVKHTRWFYADCLANYYRVPVWSERHWEIIENFIKVAVKNGINMILTPVFTPPLDTAVGKERLTVQLVGVSRDNGGEWNFDFEKLGRWIDICDRCNVKYLEISHLFTQWGAGHAPKIMATIDGEYKKIFGWETDSIGEEYSSFLDSFLPALLSYLKARGDDNRCVFHVSDEPNLDHLERYRAVKEILNKHLRGYYIMDAISDFEFYQTGVIDHPIPSNDHIEAFLEAGVPGLWTYYCCGQGIKVSNCLLAMPGYRTRILGIQMYKYNIAGFLQWGFNFYNSHLSMGEIDPYHCTDAEGAYPAGDCFQVYPAPDGTAYETIHLLLVAEAMQDIRALQLAEKLCGREAVMEAIEGALAEKITFSEYPRSSEYLLGLREKINGMIADAIK